MLSLKISPLHAKYSEELTHRDFLGAILNLGIDRSKTGDILTANNEAILFLHASLGDFLMENLTRVKHTAVMATPISYDTEDFSPQFEEIRGTLTSVRLDSLLALAFPISRSKMTAVIEAARVFVNGRLITSNGYQPKKNDIISVRKMGKIRYMGILNKTKKNRFLVLIHKYI